VLIVWLYIALIHSTTL